MLLRLIFLSALPLNVFGSLPKSADIFLHIAENIEALTSLVLNSSVEARNVGPESPLELHRRSDCTAYGTVPIAMGFIPNMQACRMLRTKLQAKINNQGGQPDLPAAFETLCMDQCYAGVIKVLRDASQLNCDINIKTLLKEMNQDMQGACIPIMEQNANSNCLTLRSEDACRSSSSGCLFISFQQTITHDDLTVFRDLGTLMCKRDSLNGYCVAGLEDAITQISSSVNVKESCIKLSTTLQPCMESFESLAKQDANIPEFELLAGQFEANMNNISFAKLKDVCNKYGIDISFSSTADYNGQHITTSQPTHNGELDKKRIAIMPLAAGGVVGGILILAVMFFIFNKRRRQISNSPANRNDDDVQLLDLGIN
eukprot:m.81875 g.81875  ORF g.81875 m.81875 type:complete len:371 (+) comp12833_c0_seq2:95-1207(+)